MSVTYLPQTASGSTPAGGKCPVNRVMTDGQVLDVKARDMTMDRGFGKHDGVTLAVSSTTLTDTEDILERPISFSYGLGSKQEFFYGYVHQITEEQKSSTSLAFTMKLLGTTIFMQAGRPRFWANKSIPAVVRDLANASLLGFHGLGHDYQWKALTQTQESDWQIAAALTNRLGYVLFNWNGVVVCEDPRKLYNSVGPYVRLIQEGEVESNERQLLEFTPRRDSEQTYEGMGIRFAYFTNDGKVAWGQQPKYSAYRFMSTLPIRSQQESEVYLDSADASVLNWLQVATARINGDATIYPGVCVEIVTSTKVKDKKYDGKWLVLSVQHKMDNQTFQTALTLARPNSSKPSQVMPFRHFWEGDTRSKPTMWLQDNSLGTVFASNLEDMPTIVPDPKRWMSSWSDSRVRSIL